MLRDVPVCNLTPDKIASNDAVIASLVIVQRYSALHNKNIKSSQRKY